LSSGAIVEKGQKEELCPDLQSLPQARGLHWFKPRGTAAGRRVPARKGEFSGNAIAFPDIQLHNAGTWRKGRASIGGKEGPT